VANPGVSLRQGVRFSHIFLTISSLPSPSLYQERIQYYFRGNFPTSSLLSSFDISLFSFPLSFPAFPLTGADPEIFFSRGFQSSIFLHLPCLSFISVTSCSTFPSIPFTLFLSAISLSGADPGISSRGGFPHFSHRFPPRLCSCTTAIEKATWLISRSTSVTDTSDDDDCQSVADDETGWWSVRAAGEPHCTSDAPDPH